MARCNLPRDPYNVIITGVGGQGNVMASRVLGNMLVRDGYYVTIGETFGASQRGGAVMSHLRISGRSSWSPQIPKGGTDEVVALEPIEGIRVLKLYGNHRTMVLSNTRPIYPPRVITGELDYPLMDQIEASVKALASKAWFIDATDEALKLGNPILGNIIMLGALSRVSAMPLEREGFEGVVSEMIPKDKLEVNLRAYDIGRELI